MTFSEHASAQEVPLGFQILQHLAFPLLSFFYVEFLWWTKNSVATATDTHHLQVVNRAVTKIVYLAFWENKCGIGRVLIIYDYVVILFPWRQLKAMLSPLPSWKHQKDER